MKKFALVGIMVALLVNINAQEEIKWMKIDEALSLLPKEPKKILVDVYTDWCGWCKVMDRTTYSDSIIIDYISNNFYAVKFNAEQKEDITLGGQTFKFVNNGGRGYHELAAFLLNGKLGYPSTVIIDEKASVIYSEGGYFKPKQFDTIINYFGSDSHKKGTFDEFSTTYVSHVRE